jgi:TetR/AcrR family transcriptional regulator, transcriptional repressor for nem operon
MARPHEFDLLAARNKALVLFWEKGYQASSLAELLAAMNIGRSSFYAAFSDKRSLFIECLDAFGERTKDVVIKARGELSPVDALQSFFEHTFIGRRTARADWGCMLVNTVLEMAGVDDDLAARASAHLAAMQATFELCLRDAGCSSGRAAELAAMLMLVNEGLRVSSRRRLPARMQLHSIETTFRLIRSALQ